MVTNVPNPREDEVISHALNQPSPPAPTTKKSPAGVRLMSASDLDWVWERVKDEHSLFFEPTEDDAQRFREFLLDPATHAFLVDEKYACAF